MISEQQLQEWERLVQAQSEDEVDLLYIFRTYDIIPQLIAEVRALEGELKEEKKRNERLVWHVNEVNQLEKEADWLASQYNGPQLIMSYGHVCPGGDSEMLCDGYTFKMFCDDCKECWRKAAREATKND